MIQKTKNNVLVLQNKNVNYAATVVSKFVWQIEMSQVVKHMNLGKKIRLPKYGLSNALTDGWTHWIGSKEEVCEFLNENTFGTQYRILTPEELIYIIQNRDNQKQLVRHIS